ncbi:DUF1579 domain-containing protein [Fuerstiella marisgermanici]|uniref:DUF1579 domain-containing protein n=1 Tax=Fuerstiella marisgermanici TaxID=1891926 RepID=A0A1P8WD47_9PLAN|nr:DUF1579 domain-containing protein [Fuerstiella marisgermanici]APZ91996.1 hypothetical protein Fuma_01597 [Fuerstiella marisgermanici]
MKNVFSLLVLFVVMSPTLWGQPPSAAAPKKEHEWLKQFEGQWSSSSKTVAAPGQPSTECTGSMKSSMLGGFWVVNKMRGHVGEVTFDAMQTIGYDSKKERYFGTWVDTMMGHMWHYEGTVDESGKKLILVAEGPDFTGSGKVTKYRDSYEFKSADLIIATSEVMGDDGKWVTFMTGEVKRDKPE